MCTKQAFAMKRRTIAKKMPTARMASAPRRRIRAQALRVTTETRAR
jgi:hypothetical protein